MAVNDRDSGAPGGPQVLDIVLTGELVTIVGRGRFQVTARPGEVVGELLVRLGKDCHPWFATLPAGRGEDPQLGAVMVLLDGEQVSFPDGLRRPVGPGPLYLIPPIPGG